MENVGEGADFTQEPEEEESPGEAVGIAFSNRFQNLWNRTYCESERPKPADYLPE